jgi:Tfp pilus assembly protein PilX
VVAVVGVVVAVVVVSKARAVTLSRRISSAHKRERLSHELKEHTVAAQVMVVIKPV